MPSKAGHLVKLIPVAIGGTYASSNAFLPTPPKDMEMLLEERECYIVTTVRNEKTSSLDYLLACRIKEFDQSLDFFFYSPSSSVKKSKSKGTAIPVRYLNDLGGGNSTEKSFNLSFNYFGSSEIKTNSFNTVWMDGLQKEWHLVNFCEKIKTVELEVNYGGTKPKLLKCEWKINGKSGKDYWKEFDSKTTLYEVPLQAK